jgi:hypothetical protein
MLIKRALAMATRWVYRAKIGQDLRRSAEGRLGIDYPFDATTLVEPAGECGGLGEVDREILRQALAAESDSSFDTLAAELRKLTGNRKQTPSEILQREGRDER